MSAFEAVQTFAGIANENEFYSHHYLAEVFKGDIKAKLDAWEAAETQAATQSETDTDTDTAIATASASASADHRVPHKRLQAWGQKWFALRGQITRAKDDAEKLALFVQLQTGLLHALGYTLPHSADQPPTELVAGQALPIWCLLGQNASPQTSTQTSHQTSHQTSAVQRAMQALQLVVVPAYLPGAETEDLLDHTLSGLHYGGANVPAALLGQSWHHLVSEALFAADQPPRYVLLLGLDEWLLLDRYKWPQNRALRFDWREILDRKDPATLQAAAALLHQTSLAPGQGNWRTGRGVVLSRAKRDAIWPVFEEYRGQLALRKLKEVDDAYRDVATLMVEEIRAGKVPASYSAIVIDETQDLGPQALRLLRAMMASNPNDLFFVGDGHQRIYTRNRAAMSKCGVDIRGRSKKLYLNYRTTDEIRKQALAVLEGCEIDDLDDGQDESQRYKSLSHGPVPLHIQVPGLEEAFAKTIGLFREWTADEDPLHAMTTCVIAASKKTRDALAKHFQLEGLKVAVIDENQNAATTLGACYFATMHRAKGLEFDRVIVLAPKSYLGDPLETDSKRKLIYVALTRAKQLAALLVV